MKNIYQLFLILFFLLIKLNSYSQSPESFNYQAVIHDNAGDLIINQSVIIQVSINDNTADGTTLYRESHTITTNDQGLINLQIGEGAIDQGLFSSITWETNKKYLKIEIDLGSGFIDMGTVQLLSVPYALFAQDVANKNDADADPANELQLLSISNDTIYLANGGYVKLPMDQVNDADNDPSNELQDILLEGDTLRLSDGSEVVFSYDSSRWAINGDKMYYNSGNVGIGSSNPVSKLEVKSGVTSGALFQVINANNDTVFAVYPDGVKVFVDSEAKGKVGGFTVSGRSPTKAGEMEILRVTPDSTRFYVNDTVTTKGKVGGFAISGRSPTKGLNTDLLFITADSTRIYVNESSGTKGKIGGFAISGRSPTKGITTQMFVTTVDSTRIFVKDSTAGFGVANIESGTAENFLNLNKQNYLIGHQTGSHTYGVYNSMIGYQAGYTNSSGSNNIFFGYKAGYLNVTGGNNVFIGTESGYVNQYTFQNTYVGYRSGYDLSGSGNTVMGSMAGENAAGGNNTFIGTSAGRIATGGNNTFLGNGAGYSFPNENTGIRNTYIGQAVGSFTSTGSYNVMLGFNSGYLNYAGSRNTFLGYNTGRNIHAGSGNVFIGYEAGNSQDGVSDRLFISNWNDLTPLIYGNFSTNELTINGTLYATTYGASDIKLKTSLTKIQSGLKLLSSLTGYYFKWNDYAKDEFDFSDDEQVGVLAQDVEKVLPQLISTNSKGYKAVDYSKLSPIIIEAIKEQQNQIEDLKSENEELKNRLAQIEKLLLTK